MNNHPTYHSLPLSPEQEERAHHFLDGTLTPAERETFVNHLSECESCRTFLIEMQVLFDEFAALEDIDPPANIVSGVMNNLPAPQSSAWSVRVGLALAGQIIIGLILLMIIQPLATTTLNNRLVWPAWLVLFDVGSSLVNDMSGLLVGLSDWVQAQGTLLLDGATLDLSLSFGLAVIFGLGLAWLIGNSLLLRPGSAPIKNGGRS